MNSSLVESLPFATSSQTPASARTLGQSPTFTAKPRVATDSRNSVPTRLFFLALRTGAHIIMSERSPVASLRLVPAGQDVVLVVTLKAEADPQWRVVKIGDQTRLEVDFVNQQPAADGGGRTSTPAATATTK